MTKSEKQAIYDHMELSERICSVCTSFNSNIEKIKSTLEGDELYGKEPNTLVVQITLKKERKDCNEPVIIL